MTQQEIDPTLENTIDEHEIPVIIEGPGEKEPVSEAEQRDEKESEYLLHLQRLQAEFDNYRKRTEKEKGQQYLFGKSQLMQQLLPVIDDFERLLEHHEQNGSDNSHATQLIYQKLVKILSDEGLELVDTEGQAFNPELHEALSVEEVDDPEKDHLIVQEWQRGYVFNERLLRPSRVKVAKYVNKGNA